MRMPLDQLVRYWKGKEEEDTSSVSGYIHTLWANMELVREMALREKRVKKLNRKSSTIRRRESVPLRWVILYWCLGPPLKTNY